MKRKSVLRLAALMVPIFLFVATAALAAEQKTTAPKPKPAPKYFSMKFSKVGGGETTLKDLIKKDRTLLVFFQTACITCKTELKLMKQEFSDNPKFDVIGVGVDVRPDQVAKFVAELGYPKTVLLDPKFTLGPKVKVTYTPAVVVLDEGGHMVDVIGGYTDGTMDQIKKSVK
jgi:protein-disulfide isomerase